MPQRFAERLSAEDLHASTWSNGPHDLYPAHAHDYDKVIVVERGSIAFGLPLSGGSVALDEGDRLDLPAGTVHDATVGPRGVTCLEAHRSAGTLGTARRRAAGTW